MTPQSRTANPRPPSADRTRVGVSTGLAARTSDKAGPRIEQVYVYAAAPPEPHPIIVDGWVGYSIRSTMMLTRNQAVELIGLLAKALEA